MEHEHEGKAVLRYSANGGYLQVFCPLGHLVHSIPAKDAKRISLDNPYGMTVVCYRPIAPGMIERWENGYTP